MVLLDSNVVIDLTRPDSLWHDWSEDQLRRYRHEGLAINQVIYAEASVGFRSMDEFNARLGQFIVRLELPWEAAFAAGKAFLAYRQRGGIRTSPLPDFYIGAHAQVSGLKLLTRDARRYRSYFPDIEIVAPA